MTDADPAGTGTGTGAPPAPAVVLVGAETPGNVGTVARAMKNFGLSELLLVDPPPLEPGGEAYGFAGHAREDVLPGATETTLEAVTERYHTVGCTAITGEDARRHVRYPYRTPADLADSLEGVGGATAVVFGRESTGLDNAELARLDEVCSIPASEEYPVLNLGQAATVVCYELRRLTVAESQLPGVDHERAEPEAVERLHDYLDGVLAAAGYDERERSRTGLLVRRLVGRARPTGREIHSLLGVLRRLRRQLGHRRKLLDRYDEPDHWRLSGEGDGDGDRTDPGPGPSE